LAPAKDPSGTMRVDVLTSDREHPIVPRLEAWVAGVQPEHDARLCFDPSELEGGRVLFLVSCAKIVGPELRSRYDHCLVLHASDLPQGRGWSPHVWELLAGAEHLTLSLLDAEDPVDSGAIWAKLRFPIDRNWLFDEINAALFGAELELMDRALTLIAEGHQPTPQPEEGVTSYPRRRPSDSELDPERPLAELFDQLRLADPVRYPAYFELRGRRYTLELRVAGEDS
jgi:methionyl-tRNA formyltransferase